MDDPQLKSLIDTYYKMQMQEPGDEFEAEPETLDEAVGGSVKLKPGKGLGGGVPAYEKGKEPKATGAQLPLANSHEVEGEEISEMVPALQKPVEGALRKTREFMQKNPVGRALGSAIAPVGRGRSTAKPAAQPGTYTRESTEAYDIVLDFLISEGYADSVENADQIMAVMAEGKIKEIVEQSALRIRAINVVDDQRRGSHGMADDMNKTKETLRKMRPYPGGFPGVRGV